MNFTEFQKRALLFLFGCIALRLLFVYIAKTLDNKYLPYLGILALGPIIGWLVIMFIKPRDTGAEAGGKIWWKPIRPIHLILYMIFAYLAFTKNQYAYVPLLIDVIFGLVLFIVYHMYMEKSEL